MLKKSPVSILLSTALMGFSVFGLGYTATALSHQTSNADKRPIAGELELVAELPIRPGNVTVNHQGRIFTTVHPLDGPRSVQLIEITGKNTYTAWPNTKVQNGGKIANDNQLDTPLGIVIDGNDTLWVVDIGLNLGKTRIFGFDIKTGNLLKRFDLDASIAPKGSFVQDLAVDEKNGWIYLADLADPSIIAINMKNGQARKFANHPSLRSEESSQMKIGGKPILFHGSPANIGINPITLSADNETIYFGAMTGQSWYGVPAKLFRDGASDDQIAASISRVGSKPISDGASTDAQGNHFFTNLNEGGIDMLSNDGYLVPLVRNIELDWPDNAHFGPNSWLYLSVNQLHKTPAFTGGKDTAQGKFKIFRVWTGTAGVVGR
jgi:hypothetical protein